MANKKLAEIVVKAKDETAGVFSSVDDSMDNMESKFPMIAGAAAVAAAAMVAALVKVVQAAAELVGEMAGVGDHFDKLSQRTGISTEKLSEWEFLTKRAGGTAGDFEAGIRRLARSMYDANRGLSTATAAWGNLGVEYKDSAGELRDVDDVLLDLADGLKNVTSNTERMALAQELLGRGGTRLLPLLQQGSEALLEQKELFRELGGAMSTEFTAGAAAVVDAQTDLETAWGGLKANLVEKFQPYIAVAIDEVALAVGSLVGVIERNESKIVGFIDNLGRAADRAVAISKVTEALLKLTGAGRAVADVEKIIERGFEGMADGADDSAESVGHLTNAMQMLQGQLITEKPAPLDYTVVPPDTSNLAAALNWWKEQASPKEVADAVVPSGAIEENVETAAEALTRLAVHWEVAISKLAIKDGAVVDVDRTAEEITKDILAAVVKASKAIQDGPPVVIPLKASVVLDAQLEREWEEWLEDNKPPEDLFMAVPVDLELPPEVLDRMAELKREEEAGARALHHMGEVGGRAFGRLAQGAATAGDVIKTVLLTALEQLIPLLIAGPIGGFLGGVLGSLFSTADVPALEVSANVTNVTLPSLPPLGVQASVEVPELDPLQLDAAVSVPEFAPVELAATVSVPELDPVDLAAVASVTVPDIPAQTVAAEVALPPLPHQVLEVAAEPLAPVAVTALTAAQVPGEAPTVAPVSTGAAPAPATPTGAFSAQVMLQEFMRTVSNVAGNMGAIAAGAVVPPSAFAAEALATGMNVTVNALTSGASNVELGTAISDALRDKAEVYL